MGSYDRSRYYRAAFLYYRCARVNTLAERRAWLKLQQYDDNDREILTLDMWGDIELGAEVSQELGTPMNWELLFHDLYSSLNTGTLKDLAALFPSE